MADDQQRFNTILQQELEQAEGVKAGAAAITLALSLVFSATLLLVSEEAFAEVARAPEDRWHLLLVASVLLVWELGIWQFVRGRRRHKLPIPWALGWLNVTMEALAPSVVVLVSAEVLGPAFATVGPPILFYGVVIALSALRLDPRISLWSGAVASASYLAAALVSVAPLSDASTMEQATFTHVARATVILIIGLTAAMVAHQLRKRIERSLELLEERNWVVGVFGRYVTDEVVDVLLNSPDGLRLGGDKREVTVLMTDLRGFSKMSERLPPERVVSLLNHYLGEMTRVIQAHGGTIDEFIGDAILVLFNAPLEQDAHARKAVACALAMQREMATVNAWNQAHGLPHIEMGIGVHTGDAVVGNIGSEQRQKYGVVGSTVNMAARIESYTVGGQVLISQRTAEAAGPGLEVRGEREVLPKGAQEPLRIYDVVGVDGLRLEVHEDRLVPIAPLDVGVRVLDGKDVSAEVTSGALVALSDREASLRVDLPLVTMQNLSLVVGPGQVFAKVLEVDGAARLRFTAWDDEAWDLLERARKAGGGA